MSTRVLQSTIDTLPSFTEAYVVSNKDPKVQERLLVRIPGLHNMEVDMEGNAIWCNHCAPFRYSSGGLPKSGDWVYVMFPNRTDPEFCIWMGIVRFSKLKEAYSEKEILDDFSEPETLEDNSTKLTVDTEWAIKNG